MTQGYTLEQDLQRLNEQNKLALWAERVSECRNSGLTVKAWCKENGVGEQAYYKWQKHVFDMAKEQHKTQFAEVTPLSVDQSNTPMAITVHMAGIAADIHNGADPGTVENVFRILELC